MTTTAEALSGPWAANLRGWLLAAGPATLLVVVQELATPVPAGPWIAYSVLLQLLVVTVWSMLVAGISRMLTGRVVLVASVLLWVGIGVGRGVVGGVVADAAGAADPEWIYRVVFWTVVTVVWMPLLTFALAHWELHRKLLATRADLADALRIAAERATEDADARAVRLTAAADDALGPALDEIRAALRQDASPLDAGSAHAIAERLDELADRSAQFTTSEAVDIPRRPSGRVSVAAASLDFELRRPVLASLLTAIATAPLLIPDAGREGGWPNVAEIVVALTVSTAVLIATFGTLRPHRFSGAQRSILSRVGVALAGVAGGAVLVGLGWNTRDSHELVITIAFPFVVMATASTVATWIALEATNSTLAARVEADQAALDDLAARVRIAERETTARVERLVRGELNGRLASCAMALGFLAGGDISPGARADVVDNVLAQLDAASRDLHARPLLSRG